MTSKDLPGEPADLHFEPIQPTARERVTSLSREADRHRPVREASIGSPQPPLTPHAEALGLFETGV
jgi:hypothetical protein